MRRMRSGWTGLLLAAALLLTGCSNSLGIEGLLRPPRLTDQQTEIYNALLASVSSKDLKLHYPKSGEYRSAFVVVNIDDEPTEEALVFYETQTASADGSSLRINVLDRKDGQWQSVYDLAGMGSGIDKIIFTPLGSDGVIHIVVGYTMLNQAEKAVKIYTYGDGALSTAYTGVYSMLEAMDITGDGVPELLMVTSNNASKTAAATMITKTEQGLAASGEDTPMNVGAVEYTSAVKGMLDTTTAALYIDSSRGGGVMGTEVLYYRAGRLRNAAYVESPDQVDPTLRSTGLACMDMDGDGIVEIPVQTPFPGYEELTRNEQLNMTNWLIWKNGEFARKYSSYYSASNGYVFVLPQRWIGAITAKVVAADNEITFYRYSDAAMANTTGQKELLRIRTEANSFLPNKALYSTGYEQLLRDGRLEYLVKNLPDKDEPLALTKSEITYNFHLLK